MSLNPDLSALTQHLDVAEAETPNLYLSMDDAAWQTLDSPLIVALAGAGCSPHVFDSVKVPGWTVCALDWASGSGPFSPQVVAIRLAARLKHRRQPTVLLGYSVGGVIAMLAALEPYVQLAGLVISNTGPHSRSHGDPSFPDRIRARWGMAEQQSFLSGCFHLPPSAALWRTLCDYLAALPPDALLQTVEGLRLIDLSARLSEIDCPTLIAHGSLDQRRPPADAQALMEAIPRASLSWLPGGHTPMVDCPAEYLAAVQPFVNGLVQNQRALFMS